MKKRIIHYLFSLPMVLILLTHQLVFSQKPLTQIELLEKKRQEALILAQNAATERQKVQEQLACKGISPQQEKQGYRQPQTAQLAELKKEQASLLAQNTALERQAKKEEQAHQRMIAQQEKQREREEKVCKQQECIRQFQEEKCGQVHEERGIALTFKNAYFYPQERILRDIFDRKGGKGGYWIEGAVRYNFWKELNVEISGSYFKHKGFALCAAECTEVKIPTLGFGLKYFLHCSDCCMCYNSCRDFWKRLSFFLGAGLRVFFYRERNYTMAGLQCTDETTVGGMINGGVEIDIYKGLFIDLFVDYNFKKLSIDCKDIAACCNPCSPCTTGNCCETVTTCCLPNCCFDIHIGGIVAGIGLGYKF